LAGISLVLKTSGRRNLKIYRPHIASRQELPACFDFLGQHHATWRLKSLHERCLLCDRGAFEVHFQDVGQWHERFPTVVCDTVVERDRVPGGSQALAVQTKRTQSVDRLKAGFS
jgi:hypothetical protein